MMKRTIPWAVIASVKEIFSMRFSHNELNNIFLYTDAPWDIVEASKAKKIEYWLMTCNKEADEPLFFLGKILERYMDRDFEVDFFSEYVERYTEEREKFRKMLAKYGLQYLSGGIVIPFDSSSSSFALKATLEEKSYSSLKIEVERALTQIETDPAGALTAASASIEAFCKIYLEQHNLPCPKDKTIKPLWAEVSKSLGLDPACLEDNDLKKILGGLNSICDGIGSLRTHAGFAHGRGVLAYKVEPRHARLAIFAAHTLILFALETSEKRKTQVASHKA